MIYMFNMAIFLGYVRLPQGKCMTLIGCCQKQIWELVWNLKSTEGTE